MMSVLRVRSGGMLAPWAVHVLIDIAIVLILLFLVRQIDTPLSIASMRSAHLGPCSFYNDRIRSRWLVEERMDR